MSTLRKIQRLPNMIDANALQVARVRETADLCMSVLSLRGYSRIETPLLEETELFLRKSGGELSSRLYDFVEPGGFRTSLRPEFTAPVIRYAIATGEAGSKECRYQYFGPVFRYASPKHSYGQKTRQFNQLGAELIGAPAPVADGEVMAMALEGLEALQLPPVTLAVGHVGLLRQLLKKFELSERAAEFLLASADLLAAGEVDQVRTVAKKLGVLSTEGATVADEAGKRQEIEAVLDRSLAPLGVNAGSRTREEVIARLARKQTHADDPAKFESALSMLSELMAISGEPGTALDDGRKVAASSGLDESCYTQLEQVVESAVTQGVDEARISVRYGFARGFAYYTGMVFDILPTPDANDSLGGGGRYDGLTRALGHDADVPALGFAYNFDDVLAHVPLDEAAAPGVVLVRPATADAMQAAVEAAAELRQQGRAAVVETSAGSDLSSGYSEVIIVDASGGRS